MLRKARLSLEQQIQIDTTGSCDNSDNHSVIMVSSNSDGEFLAVIEDIPTHSLLPVQEQPDFTGILKRRIKKNSLILRTVFQNRQNLIRTWRNLRLMCSGPLR